MARVFTITEGLENMGALKSGGQGSVYKGRRIGPIVTAVKLLPTPIHSESEDDKHFRDFRNEVEKLKKVNEQPNPNVVKILSSGITETGNLPFIEMEYIEGPDLEELLKPPHPSLFTIKETIKVAEHLSNALAHCHRVDVKHGDIKSNNVKFNHHSGNYVLLDFGLAIMSDEQRRTSLRHAGAIEFMAPEQNEGVMLFETDIYSFGIILFELLAGTVPFPLKDKGETARNMVMISHMETAVPDVLALRKQNLPQEWSFQKKEHEMNVPGWLVSAIYKCLEKKPEKRFKDGIALHDYITLNSTLTINKGEVSSQTLTSFQGENQKLLEEKEKLQGFLAEYQGLSEKMDAELKFLRADLEQKEKELKDSLDNPPAYTYQNSPVRNGVSKSAFFALLFLTVCLGVFAAYSLLKDNKSQPSSEIGSSITDTQTTNAESSEEDATGSNKNLADDSNINKKRNDQKPQETSNVSENKTSDPLIFDTAASNSQPNGDTTSSDEVIAKYKLASKKAYFHNQPDESTRRRAFINHWNNAIVEALDEQNGFIYIIYTNSLGQTSKGWLNKKDLVEVNN
ncbi:MAG: serine/threonine protein kinase [Bacteroidota bacterium]|nr:serine/threonine protein kinase [Bacteroidota bacterium]